jgi:hypothetical protein
VNIPESAELVAEDVSEISWEDLIDEMHANPAAHIIETGVCNSGSDPTMNTVGLTDGAVQS